MSSSNSSKWDQLYAKITVPFSDGGDDTETITVEGVTVLIHKKPMSETYYQALLKFIRDRQAYVCLTYPDSFIEFDTDRRTMIGWSNMAKNDPVYLKDRIVSKTKLLWAEVPHPDAKKQGCLLSLHSPGIKRPTINLQRKGPNSPTKNSSVKAYNLLLYLSGAKCPNPQLDGSHPCDNKRCCCCMFLESHHSNSIRENKHSNGICNCGPPCDLAMSKHITKKKVPMIVARAKECVKACMAARRSPTLNKKNLRRRQ